MKNLYHNATHSSELLQEAFQVAHTGRKNAYAPYSNFLVGAAVKCSGHTQIFCGCNVENASYGATICAERSALVSAIATLGQVHIDFMLVCAEGPEPVPPCALCLQVISEFANDNTIIYLANTKKILTSITLLDLLPYPFSVKSMPDVIQDPEVTPPATD